MSHECYLAVDLGAESGRVIAGLLKDRKLELVEQHRFSNGAVPVAGTLRWDVLRLWSEILTGLTKAAAVPGQTPLSVGVDTWGVDYVLLAQNGEILGQPYHYRDPRTQGVMERAFEIVPRKEIFAATGLQFMTINTLYQLIAMQEQFPHLLEQAERFLMMGDFFHWLLSGSQVVEFTNATTTQCLDASTRQWASPLLRQFNIPTRMFPEVVAPGTSLGRMRADVAERCRMPRIDVVAPATHDTGSAVAAIPTHLTGTGRWAYISSGTWSLMGLELNHAVLTPRALELNVTNEGGIDGTYRLLKNIMGLWLVQECKRAWERQGQTYDYDDLTRMAAMSAPLASLIDPDSPSFLAPSDMSRAITDWCQSHGERVPETPGAIVRCCLESLALKYRTVLHYLEELSGTRVEVIHIVGGGSRNELLNQFTANATGRPVITGPVEATAFGNVLVQARTRGAVSSLAEMREIVRNSCEMKTYEPEQTDQWDDAYRRFNDLLAMPVR